MRIEKTPRFPPDSLHLPPARLTEVKDLELAKLVDSVDHLKSITQPSERETRTIDH